MQGLEILAYDGAKKVYTFNSFDSLGMMGSGTLTVKGSTWTSIGTATIGTTTMRDRCTLEFGAGGSTPMIRCEMSTDGKTWTPTFEGRPRRPVAPDRDGAGAVAGVDVEPAVLQQ